MGSVPPNVSLGTTDEVVAYCKRLIDIVGKMGVYSR